MTNSEAAALLVGLVSEFRSYGYNVDKYCEAVALACAALLKTNGANQQCFNELHWRMEDEE